MKKATSYRLSQECLDLLREIAKRDGRSQSNMIEYLVRVEARGEEFPDPYQFVASYILQECGSLSWWTLNKKWKAIKAKEIAKIVVDEARGYWGEKR